MTPPARTSPPIVLVVRLLLVAAGLALTINPSHLERDVAQERLDAAGAPLGPGHTLGQTFASRRAGLRRIEVLAVVYDPSREAPPEARVCLDLERLDEPSASPATSCLPVAGIEHNQTLTFDFSPRADSRNATYRLTLRCGQDLGLGVWLTDHEAYAAGEAWEDGAPRQGDLYFRTFHDYTLTDALTDAVTGLGRRAWPIAVTLVVLLAPGAAFLVLLPIGRRLEPVVALALAAALSLAFWPLLLLWATTLGLRLGPLGAWSAVVVLAGAAAFRYFLRRPERRAPWHGAGPCGGLRVRLAALRRRGPRPGAEGTKPAFAGSDASLRRPERRAPWHGAGPCGGLRVRLAALRRRGPRPGAEGTKPAFAGSDASLRRPERSEGPCRCLRGALGCEIRSRAMPWRPALGTTDEPRVGSRRRHLWSRDPWPYVALAVVMLLVVVTRAVQVRDIVLPAWVDSVHHTMIVRLIADGGRVPATYRPYMPVDAFHYHFGFHAGAAALAWLSGLTVEQAVLLFGQALNVLAPLTAYTLAWRIGRSRWGGVAAALVVGALCYMPAYYVTWGRYTQLAGLVMLPPLMLVTAWVLERGRPRWEEHRPVGQGFSLRSGRGGAPPSPVGGGSLSMPGSLAALGLGRSAAIPGGQEGAIALGPLVLTALLLAGLVLTHYRVLVFYAVWAVPQGVLLVLRGGRAPSPPPSPRVQGEGAVDPSPRPSPRAQGEGADSPSPPPSPRVQGEGAVDPSLRPSSRVQGDGEAGARRALFLSPEPRGEAGARRALFLSPVLRGEDTGGGEDVCVAARIVGRGVLCGGLALLLALPWAVGFLARVAPGFASTYGGWAAGEGGNAFPSALLNVGWTRPLLYLAAAGALWGLVRRRGEALVIATWVGLCVLVANPHVLGLADTWLITNSAVFIAFWLPVGALCGWLVGDLGHLLARVRLPRIGPVGRQGVSALLLAVAVVLAGVGSWRMVDIVNPVTVLVAEEDLDGLVWAREHTPPDALFLVNTGVWQAPMRYGTDAGWWLNVVADRRTTLPSLLYLMGGMDYFEGLNALAIAVEEAESVDDRALLDRLRAAGVTHVFVGARGGHLLPRDLDPSPHYRTLYTHGPVRIYEVVYP